MKHFFLYPLLFMANNLCAQTEIPLYDVIPNSRAAANIEKTEMGADGILRASDVSIPALSIFLPQKPNGSSIIICPGGGYKILALVHEGYDVAKELNDWGITVFVLKYRLPDERTMEDKSIGPLQDAERAMQWVRQHAKKYHLHPHKIGVMGFSAGGHLAASLSTRYAEVLIPNPQQVSLRPDFSVLIYPVISFTDSLAHQGSRSNLIGTEPAEEKIKKFSNELHVNGATPPAFLVHAKDDAAVPYQNSVVYYDVLKKNNVPAALKLFEKGGHGFGMNNTSTTEKWMDDLKLWLQKEGFIR